MKKHLQFIDGNSDKFWQIAVTGTTYTVTYGRNGSTGVSQSKSFATAEECQLAAEKSLAEKVKKGYSEDGQIVGGAVKTKTAGQISAQEAIETLDEIIKYKHIEALLPFLKEKSPGNIAALKKHIKHCRRYWMTFVDFREEPEFRNIFRSDWGRRGDAVQARIITLSAIALFDKTDISSWNEALPILNDVKDETVLHILEWARPNWLPDYMLSEIKKQVWIGIDYAALRFWETQGLLDYNPELYALCISRFNEFDYIQEKARPTRQYIASLVLDPVAYQRDVPLLFDYETQLHSHVFRDNKTDREFHSLWGLVFKQLLDEHKMDRSFFIEHCLQIQTKDWNNDLKSFFRKQIETLDVSVDELLIHQEMLFTYLHAPFAPIVNFGIVLIKKIIEQPGFNVHSFLEWLEPMMMRNDCKTAIKTLFPVLEKLSKTAPAYSLQIASVLMEVFVIDNLSLQERAVKALSKIAPASRDELQNKLGQYAPLMQGNTKVELEKLWGAAVISITETEQELYVQADTVLPDLLQEAVVLPASWNDIVFQFGNFIRSDEVLDGEVLINTFITQRHLFPADYAVQLAPYVRQMENQFFDAVYKNLIRDFLIAQTVHIAQRIVIKVDHSKTLQSLYTISSLLEKAQEKIQRRSTLPLLSLPTHKPYWIAPQTLVERLLAYQQAREKPDAVDLAIAISRMPRQQTERALPLLAQLEGPLKSLLEFCLGLRRDIQLQERSVLSKLITFVGGQEDMADNHALWVVAARTYYPSETFQALEKTAFGHLPFVLAPVVPRIYFKERWYDQYNHRLQKYERINLPSYELKVDFPSSGNVPHNLLYSMDMKRGKIIWGYDLFAEANIYHRHSLMPQNPEPLALLLLQAACFTASDTSGALEGYLNVANRPEFRFSEITLTVFACCFFQEKKNTRLLATEVLISHIQRRSIDPERFGALLARLISEKYGVVLRAVDALAAVKDVSGLHNSALQIMLDNLFKHLNIRDKMPTNLKKLVEHYVDLLHKTRQKPSPGAITFFEKWQENASLKSLVKQILQA